MRVPDQRQQASVSRHARKCHEGLGRTGETPHEQGRIRRSLTASSILMSNQSKSMGHSWDALCVGARPSLVTGASALDLPEVRGETGVVEQIEGPVTEPACSEAE